MNILPPTSIPDIIKMAGDFITEIEASDGTNLSDIAAHATMQVEAKLCNDDMAFYKLVLKLCLIHKHHQTASLPKPADLH